MVVYGQILDRESRSVEKRSARIALMRMLRFSTVPQGCVRVPINQLNSETLSVHTVTKLESLKAISTKKELALLLGVKPSALTYTLYILKPSNQYVHFDIPKKNGGKRGIDAPTKRLKSLQSKLSDLLLDCIDNINDAKEDKKNQVKHGITKNPTLSHGFSRKKSIMTNSVMHTHQKNVLNIDLDDFFGSFNFGRVRGFFVKNRNFLLHPDIATVIAQLSCFGHKLPQGSPSSPVITNLITHSLDIKLAHLAQKYSCIYSRYADDITFSTREATFPPQIMKEDEGLYTPGKRLRREIESSGFSINSKKTRIQYKDSRQDVTGLVVNKKPNVKKEYWRTAKSQCNLLFQTGEFYKTIDNAEFKGNINELEGQLNFIDQVDIFNRLRQKPPLNRAYQIASHGHNTSALLSGREQTFSRFLYYRFFYANSQPTILCEGKTDNIYLKSAINNLQGKYPKLAKAKSASNDYELLVNFFSYSKRTRFLLELYGGTSYLGQFVAKFHKNYQFFGAPTPQSPVIILLDNDSGAQTVIKKIKTIASTTSYPSSLKKDDYKKSDFVHIIHNLYIVFTPLENDKDTEIENLFDNATRNVKLSGKSFNYKKDFDKDKHYGKEVFANKVVGSNKKSINFDGFRLLLERLTKAIDHYDSIK